MTRSEQIEKAARALVNGTFGDPAPRFAALRSALALPPDPLGECCRRAAEAAVAGEERAREDGYALGRREGAEAMREAAAEEVRDMIAVCPDKAAMVVTAGRRDTEGGR